MKTQAVSVAVAFSLLVFGCADPSYYYEDDSAAQPVTVEPTAPAETTSSPVESTAPDTAAMAKSFVKALPANPLAGPDGLERSHDWAPVGWDNPCSVSVWKRSESADDVVMVVRLEGGASDKSAVMRPVNLALAETGKIRMDIYNSTSRRIRVAFATFSSIDRIYSESKAIAVGPAWNHLEFDLASSTYKTAASNWEHTAKLWGPESVVELVVLFYDEATATLAVDRLEVDVVPETQEPAGEGPI